MENTKQGVNEWAVSSPALFTHAAVSEWECRMTQLIQESCGRDSNRQNCSYELCRSVHNLHSQFTICRDFINLFRQASLFEPRDQQCWGWYPLIDTPVLRIGLLSLHRLSSIPLHDHPDAYGVQKVISGKVRVRQYQFDTDSERHRNLVSLERVADIVLNKGESTSFLPVYGNLHELESVSPSSVILNVMVNPYRPLDRSWYYQVPFTQNGNRGLYNRIGKRSAA